MPAPCAIAASTGRRRRRGPRSRRDARPGPASAVRTPTAPARGARRLPAAAASLLAEDDLLAEPDPAPLLEVLTRRYYKIRQLGDVDLGDDGVVLIAPTSTAAAGSTSRGARPARRVDGPWRRSPRPRRRRGAGHGVVDLYLPCPPDSPSATVASAELAALAAAELPAAGATGRPDRLARRRRPTS